MGINPPEFAGKGVVGNLADGASQLYPRRSTSNDDKGEGAPTLPLIGGPFGTLKRPKNPPSHVERVVKTLGSGCQLRPFRVAEVCWFGTGGKDQKVTLHLTIAQHDPFTPQIDGFDPGQFHSGVALAAQDGTNR